MKSREGPWSRLAVSTPTPATLRWATSHSAASRADAREVQVGRVAGHVAAEVVLLVGPEPAPAGAHQDDRTVGIAPWAASQASRSAGRSR